MSLLGGARRRGAGPALAVAVAVLSLLPAVAGASDDPSFAAQWALGKIKAPAAWSTSTGQGVRIGIVDTGIDLHHEDLAGKIVAHTNCIGAAGDPAACSGSAQDDHGHGTHVAGIAAAWKDNGKGIAGVAPDAQLVVVKALDETGGGTTEDINAGIRWVVDHGARVVSLSLGSNFLITSLFGTPLSDGIAYAWANGAVPVLAAGNNNLGLGLGSAEYGAMPAIVVAATGPQDELARYTSPPGNARWAILAPGGAGGDDEADDILSTHWSEGTANDYAYLAGTSMATPHVAGAVALVLALGRTPAEAVGAVLGSADATVRCGSTSPNCRGRLDAAAAVALAAAPADIPIPAPATGPIGLPPLGHLPVVGPLLGPLLQPILG